jgi:hypothetical protein
VLCACGVWLRRATCTFGLPDIGDPFDVVAFREFRLPADQDAMAFIREAALKVGTMPSRRFTGTGPGGWSQADPAVHHWVEANRESLELLRKGADLPDGIPPRLDPPRINPVILDLSRLDFLAFLEASRLEEQGAMAEAWIWYRAVFRSWGHVMRRGGVYQRYFAIHATRELAARITKWAADPRNNPAVIRRALAEIRAGEPAPDRDIFSLKVEYIHAMQELEKPDGWVQQPDDADRTYRIAGEPLPPNLAWSAYAARRFLNNEPERSKRVLRLVIANWLAHAEALAHGSQKPAVRVRFVRDKLPVSLFLYDSSQAARPTSMAPKDLASWIPKTLDAKRLLANWLWPEVRISEQRAYRILVLSLAEELYRREHGVPAPSDDALVGPYLDHLPGNGSDELDDGSAATVDDPQIIAPDQPDRP